jgi:RHS repeat-associated protein
VDVSNRFTGTASVATGTTTRFAVTATDGSGNSTTEEWETDAPATSEMLTYDANGNLTAQGTKTYEWDAANRLVRVLDGGSELARFAYDGYGRRAQKITATTRSYVYDGIDIIEERVGASTMRMVHGAAIDQPLAAIDGAGSVSYYLADHLGSIVQQTDASAAVTLTRQYDPFGVPLQGATVSGYAFTGREWDAETSLYYYRARYYSPEMSRFLSEDSAGLGHGPTLYAYVGNAPSGFRDPSGHQQAATLVWGAVGAGAAGGTVLLPGAGTVAGAIGAGIGALIVVGAAALLAPMTSKPPDNAYDPNGPKAPGKPTPADGFVSPKGGDRWVPNPNGRGMGWEASDGRVWVPTGWGNAPHGGPHWDVQDPRTGRHIPVPPKVCPIRR